MTDDREPMLMTVELNPGTAAFFGLPSRLILPADGETPLPDGDQPRASLPAIARGLEVSVERGTEMASSAEVHRFLRRWPQIANLDRYLRRGSTSFVREVARSLLQEDPHDPPPLSALALLEGQEGNWDLALDLLARAPDEAGSHPPLRLQYALSLAGAGRREEAVDHLDALAQRSRIQSLARFWRYEVREGDPVTLSRRLAEAMRSISPAGEGEAAEEEWNRLEEGFPDNPEVLFYRALHRDPSGEEESESLLRRVVEADPDHEPAVTALASRLARSGRPKEGLLVVDEALTRAPHQPSYHAVRGQILEQVGDPESALESYRAVFAGPLSHVPAHAFLTGGPGILRLGSPREARTLLEETIEARPGDPLPFQLLARMDEAEEHPEAAERRLREAQRVCGPVPSLQYALGDFLRRRGRRVEAEGLFRALVHRHPRSVWGHRGLGDLVVEEQPARAMEHYLEAIRCNPSLPLPGYDYLRGVAALRAGDPSQARRWLERCVAIEPDNARYWCDLGASYFYTGDIDRAISATERALRLRPGHPGFLHNLAAYHEARFRGKPWKHWSSLWSAFRLRRQVRRASQDGWRRDLWGGPEGGEEDS
jgi:tetratricopeptide (TPR) repeat protein